MRYNLLEMVLDNTNINLGVSQVLFRIDRAVQFSGRRELRFPTILGISEEAIGNYR